MPADPVQHTRSTAALVERTLGTEELALDLQHIELEKKKYRFRGTDTVEMATLGSAALSLVHLSRLK